jgi:hypothetical protein
MTAKSSGQYETNDESQVEGLLRALCERLTEVLPADRFDVGVEHGMAVRILGKGSRHGDSLWLTPVVVWHSQLSVEDRLQLFLDQACRRLQSFVATGHAARWPTAAAEPRVSIDDDRILVSWGGTGEDEAPDVALRPILRSDIGI